MLDTVLEEFSKYDRYRRHIDDLNHLDKFERVARVVKSAAETQDLVKNSCKIAKDLKGRSVNGFVRDAADVRNIAAGLLIDTILTKPPEDGQIVKKQHWVPTSFLRRFADVKTSRLFMSHFSNGYHVKQKINDSGFIAENFHDQRLETFYTQVEQLYGIHKNSPMNIHHKSAVALFCIVLFLRHPSHGYRTFKDFVMALDDMLQFEVYELTMMSPYNLGFTDYMPFRDFGGVWVFPLSSREAAIISNDVVAYPMDYVEKYCRAVERETVAGRMQVYHNGEISFHTFGCN